MTEKLKHDSVQIPMLPKRRVKQMMKKGLHPTVMDIVRQELRN